MPKVLSIRQPWASMIVRGLKRFEVRSWSTEYRGELIIHASSAAPTAAIAAELLDEDFDLPKLLRRIGISSLADMRALPRSAIVGRVSLVDCLDSDQVAAATTVDDATVLLGQLDGESFYWRLLDAVEIDPVTGVDGRLNLWELDEAIAGDVVRALVAGRSASFRSDAAGEKPETWSDLEDDEEGEDDDDFENSEAGRRMTSVSPELAAIVGAATLARADVIKGVWKYIVDHGLQDERNPRMINPDEKLGRVIGRRRISMFTMTDKISQHLVIPEVE